MSKKEDEESEGKKRVVGRVEKKNRTSEEQEKYLWERREGEKARKEVTSGMKQSFDLIEEMSEHLHDKESFSVFTFRLRHLVK